MYREKICQMGDFSYYGVNFTIGNAYETSIGKYCSIAHNVILGPGQHDSNLLTTSPITDSASFSDFPKMTNPEFLALLAMMSGLAIM